MNSPFTPVGLRGDNAHVASGDVSALLTLLADPAAAKARLEELVAEKNAALDAATAVDAARKQAAADRSEAIKAVAEHKHLAAKHTARETELDAREVELNERAKNIDHASAASVKQREGLVLLREQAMEREEKRLAAVKTDLEGKHAKIKDLATGLT